MVEGINFPQRFIKSIPSRALVIRINLVFLALFMVIYTALLLRPFYHENAASIVRCSFRECHHKEGETSSLRVKAVLEEATNKARRYKNGNRTNHRDQFEFPSLLKRVIGNGNNEKKKVGVVNMDEEIIRQWNDDKKERGEAVSVKFERVSELFKWEDLFPEWIDEEEESEVPTCPEIPMPELKRYKAVDAVVARLPRCGEKRDVFRLQVHLVAASMAAKRGKKGVKVLFWSECRPMMELFRCCDMVERDGDWWLFRPDVSLLNQKLALPLGSCQLALPLWGQGIDEVYDATKMASPKRREAYATVLHSSESYVCGAIALAQSLKRSKTRRDMILLHDGSITRHKLSALASAGWVLRPIKRIRNPKAEPGSYNEYNYSKLRLWQLTDYDRIVFVDADAVVLRSLDLLFRFPEISAVGNDFSIFNSGVMVIDPSECTFRAMEELVSQVVSYNGGDQGFLNEVFVWWHRLPRRVNLLKNFWENSTATEISFRNELFGADPPKAYTIHFLGWKPWMCYRDYDCNWDKQESFVYASDVAHRRWWIVHDAMDVQLQRHCRLTKKRRIELDWDRKVARKKALENGHWRINITDPRRHRLVD